MQNQKQNDLQKENEKLQKQLEENDGAWSQAYKCNQCGNSVNFAFILPFIKASGLCPDCFTPDEE